MLIFSFVPNAMRRCAHPRDADDVGDCNSRQQHADGADHGVKSDTCDEGRNEHQSDCGTESLAFHDVQSSNPRARVIR